MTPLKTVTIVKLFFLRMILTFSVFTSLCFCILCDLTELTKPESFNNVCYLVKFAAIYFFSLLWVESDCKHLFIVSPAHKHKMMLYPMWINPFSHGLIFETFILFMEPTACAYVGSN